MSRLSYSEALDDENKYALEVTNAGKVLLKRYNAPWLENPEGAKAWIAAADLIERLRERIVFLEGELDE